MQDREPYVLILVLFFLIPSKGSNSTIHKATTYGIQSTLAKRTSGQHIRRTTVLKKQSSFRLWLFELSTTKPTLTYTIIDILGSTEQQRYNNNHGEFATAPIGQHQSGPGQGHGHVHVIYDGERERCGRVSKACAPRVSSGLAHHLGQKRWLNMHHHSQKQKN